MTNERQTTNEQMINVVFLDKRNDGRSLMAEAVLNFVGQGRFWAYSAGRDPAAAVDPIAIETLREAQIPCGGLWPKSWTRFAVIRAPRMNLAISLNSEILISDCPRFPGRPLTVARPIEDPEFQPASQEDKRTNYKRTLRQIEELAIRLSNIPALAMWPVNQWQQAGYHQDSARLYGARAA